MELTLKWNDHLGQPLGQYPLPGVELRMVGREIDIRVVSGKAHDEPFLPLAAVASSPNPASELDRQVVLQPHPALAENLGLISPDLLLALPQRCLYRSLTWVEPAL